MASAGLITADPNEVEVQPSAFVTVKVWVPELSPLKVVLVPLPLVVVPPGLAVTVQLPVAGSPDKKTLPVLTPQIGWVIIPTEGAPGVTSAGLIVMDDVDSEIQPLALVTVKV